MKKTVKNLEIKFLIMFKNSCQQNFNYIFVLELQNCFYLKYEVNEI